MVLHGSKSFDFFKPTSYSSITWLDLCIIILVSGTELEFVRDNSAVELEFVMDLRSQRRNHN